MQLQTMIGSPMKQVILMVKEPTNVTDVIYFTRRKIDEKGFAMAWVYKQPCPKCKKADMGKPKDPKTGKVKIRAKEYICPACSYTAEKVAYEETLTCEVKYTCPHCGKNGEDAVPFKRKRVQRKDPETGKKKALDVIRVVCGSCEGNVDISKKMK